MNLRRCPVAGISFTITWAGNSVPFVLRVRTSRVPPSTSPSAVDGSPVFR